MHIPFAREPERGDPIDPAQKKGSLDGLPALADVLISIGAMLAGQGRAKATADAAQPTACGCAAGGVYCFDGWRLDRLTCRLTDASGALVPLSAREMALLTIFLDAPGQLLMREQLAAGLPADDADDPSVELEILGLRRKLEIDARYPEVIITDRDENGVGYAFALDVEVNGRG
jgi:DNA-binding response OmpR family regulator